MAENQFEGRWALVLGASSGFGAASARALARAGMDIFGVHLDLKSTLPRAKQVIADVEALGRQAVFFNKNAADARKRGQILDKMQEVLEESRPSGVVHVMLHSLAFGTLLPFITVEPGEQAVARDQMDMTLNVMAHSMVYWVQDLVARKMLVPGSRVFSMTSAGSHRVVHGYGAVSAAKAALESHTRQLALELAPKGILVNCIQAGVTDTPALRMIPNSDKMVAEVMARHPAGRMTTPEDVAQTLVALSDPALTWISGSVVRVDGGEDIAT
jgi:enoyl-[acyl-carrier protein] reductase III